ncbi:hypothetical protein [Clostridium rectalis]|uniref:hypothetical protein n=1 Tax=Clostridium rectalis TaxID=2040295 RepID=UPI000F62D838|nr:hypothetical protein [Clostridium rectalis]
MWIRTQDKKQLVKIIKVQIGPILGDKKNKVNIWGQFAPAGLFSSNKVLLGMYPTNEKAIEEIDRIEESIISNPKGVYNMSSC